MGENEATRKNEESKQNVAIHPELLAEEYREFYSSPCSMREFEEGEEESHLNRWRVNI
jgi:hypothetical protein